MVENLRAGGSWLVGGLMNLDKGLECLFQNGLGIGCVFMAVMYNSPVWLAPHSS
jgi:hypothetical protein